MKLSDLTVEVRDKSLARLGVIRPEELDLTCEDHFNDVGSWTLNLAAEHPLAPALRTPGSGLVVHGPTDVLFSGPMEKAQYATTPEDPGGYITFEGVTDNVILADMLAFPQPENLDPMTQNRAHDTRTGAIETIMHGFVAANVGPLAPAPRRRPKLIMGPDLGRGGTTTKSARFPVLGTLLSELAVVGGLGFRIVQRGSNLVFETYAITDRTRLIRLDVRNNTLSAQRVAVTAPGVTQAIVAGQGELTERQFLAVDNPVSKAAEDEWNRRIEKFIDQRQTNDEAELKQAGDESLEENGFTGVAVQAVPMEDTSMEFVRTWYLGDRVAVVVDNQELPSPVTGMLMRADKEGFRIGALLGDATNFDRDAALLKRMMQNERRLSALERASQP